MIVVIVMMLIRVYRWVGAKAERGQARTCGLSQTIIRYALGYQAAFVYGDGGVQDHPEACHRGWTHPTDRWGSLS